MNSQVAFEIEKRSVKDANAKVASLYQSQNGTTRNKWEIVEKYLPLVKSLVSRMKIYFPEEMDSQDIYSIGLLGLIAAVNNYNEKRQQTFGQYAKIRVKGALLDELRRIDCLSRDKRSAVKKYHREVSRLENELKRSPTDKEICNSLNLSLIECQKLRSMKNPIHIPLEVSKTGDGFDQLSISEVLSDPNELNGRDIAQDKEAVDILKVCLKYLDDTTRNVLVFYYLENLRLAEIALLLNLTESRISQIHAKGLSQLRILLKEKMNN